MSSESQEITGVTQEEKLGHVTLLGYHPHDILRQEIARARIFLAPSKTAADGETAGGAPVVVTEAQAAGLSSHWNLHASILVREGDIGALSTALKLLSSNPELLAKMANAGRERTQNFFDVGKQVERIEEIYSELAAKGV